jgi:uncharacterized protein (TIGR02231 family)
MRKRPLHLFALGGLAAALALVAQHSPANQPAAGQPPAKDAPPAVKINPSKVVAVTVYSSSALVTREVEATGPAGRVELVVSPLPSTTVVSSLYAEGSSGVRVLTTRYRTRPIVADTRADVQKLLDEIKQLQLAREKIEADLGAVLENAKMLTKMEGFLAVTTVQATEKGGLNAEQAINLAKHIRESRAEGAKETVNLKQQIQANQEKADAAQRKMKELTAGVSRYENDAVIVVDKADAGAGTIRLNYLVENASWQPQYKLRADKNGKEQVALEYLAGVVQNTGEEWSNVRLVLSTAQPMLNAIPPDLQTLHVTAAAKGAVPAVAEFEEQIRSLRTKAQKDLNENRHMSGVGLVNTAGAREQCFELFNPEIAVKRGAMLSYREGPTVSYRIATPLTVASRSDVQVLEVARAELKADFYYKAVPVLSPHAYRMADMVNKSEHVILPGEATMYVGTDFVGQMSLPLVATGESFTAGFGVDPQIQVHRAMVDKLRTTSGGNQQLKFDYRILVSNFKNEKAKLQVWDRLPYADNDSIGVSLSKTTPELSKDGLYQREQRPGNLLRWDLTADANTHGEKATPINFEFKLELDRNMTIGGFQTTPLTSGVSADTPLPVITAADRVKIKAAMDKLSPEDRKLAEQQIFCAVDQDTALGSTGPIIKVMAKTQPLFVCCKGCEAAVKADPDDAILQFQRLMNRVKSQK